MSPPAGLHPEARSRRFAWRILCARCVASSSRCRISPRVVTRRRSTSSGGRSPGTCASSTCTPIADHNRSVFTCIGPPADLVEGLAAAIAVAAERIDLRTHEGVHPRVGAADVVPFVRFTAGDPEPEHAARLLGERVGDAGHPGPRLRRPRRRPSPGLLPDGRRRGARRPARVRGGRAALRPGEAASDRGSRPSRRAPAARRVQPRARHGRRRRRRERSPRRSGRATAAFRACRPSAFGSRAPAARRSR